MSGREDGVVLINVLVVLALAASVVVAMLTLGDLSIARSRRFADAAAAQALVSAGEASAIVVLRRDLAETPDGDSLDEPWAAVAQQDIAVAGGRFALAIEDAQSRLNLNSVAGQGAAGLQTLARIVAALDMPEDVTARIVFRLAQKKPMTGLGELAGLGLKPRDLARLADVLTVLPTPTPINLNTAPEPILQALIGNPVAAKRLIDRRKRDGYLTATDLADEKVVLPPGSGYTTSYFRVTVRVTVGETPVTVRSLIQRQASGQGPGEVVVVRRENDAAAEVPAPPPL